MELEWNENKKWMKWEKRKRKGKRMKSSVDQLIAIHATNAKTFNRSKNIKLSLWSECNKLTNGCGNTWPLHRAANGISRVCDKNANGTVATPSSHQQKLTVTNVGDSRRPDRSIKRKQRNDRASLQIHQLVGEKVGKANVILPLMRHQHRIVEWIFLDGFKWNPIPTPFPPSTAHSWLCTQEAISSWIDKYNHGAWEWVTRPCTKSWPISWLKHSRLSA